MRIALGRIEFELRGPDPAKEQQCLRKGSHRGYGHMPRFSLGQGEADWGSARVEDVRGYKLLAQRG